MEKGHDLASYMGEFVFIWTLERYVLVLKWACVYECNCELYWIWVQGDLHDTLTAKTPTSDPLTAALEVQLTLANDRTWREYPKSKFETFNAK